MIFKLLGMTTGLCLGTILFLRIYGKIKEKDRKSEDQEQ